MKFTPLIILDVRFSGNKDIHKVVQPSLLSFSRTFLSPQTETLYQLNNTPHSPLQLLVTSIPLSVSINLPILSAPYKKNYIIFDLLYLAYFI